MTKFTKLVALASIMLSVSVATNAQTNEKDYEPYPHMFVGVQGGVQNTFNKEFNNWKTFTPTASLSFGSWFIPQVGARLHFNGLWNKSGVDYLDDTEDGHYKYNYLTSSADLLLNLCTIFGKKDYYPVNLYYVMGLGANYAWEGRGRAEDAAATYLANMKYADNDNRWAFNGRVGLGLDIPVCKNLSVNVEGDLNHIVPGKSTKFNTDLLQLTVQAGLAYKFGFKKKPAPEEVWETRIDTIWYDDIAYTPRVEDGSITWNVFYKIRESDFNDPDVNDPAEAQLAAIGAFLKDHRECTVSIKSYADVQTGNPKINMGYSQQRSEKAVKALTEAGVDPSIITAEYFGDTVQPFAENDKNRVSIIKATGLKDVKDQYTVKKFRTREVRELVK
ncbi:MAG: OmpA family protein [Bacteroidaceae bacterium]|nr:OmpA family protein [Bacteroidaceae bacterium]MBQ7988414.1 OmpA family protein [Bacteroidaceae bacterium]